MAFYRELERAWARPDQVAVHAQDGPIPYRELRRRVRRAAGFLRSRGIGRGDVVALQLPRSPAFLEVHLGALSIGAITLPMNDRYTDEEVAYLLSDSGADLALLASEEVRPALDAAAPVDPDPSVGEEDVAVLCYTSGTTGRPKGARITHGNLAATVRALHEAWRWTADDVLVHALPLYHVHGLFVAQHGALHAGATAVWLPRFDADAVLDAVDAHRATIFMGVPTFYHRLLAAPDRARDLSSMRLWTSGSAPLPAADHRAFAERFGHAILERYGMTEVGIVLSNPYDGERRPGAVGHPLPGVRARITHPETGVPVEDGAVGEIRIAGPSVFRGYLNRPDATAAALEGGWMHTGDLGRIDEDGYFHVVGRMKDLVLVGGLNVYPREIEAVLCDHPAVTEAAVVGVPDPDLGERVVAAIVCRTPIAPDALLEWLGDRVAAYKRPREIRVLDALPRNSMGKVQKAVLRDRWYDLPLSED